MWKTAILAAGLIIAAMPSWSQSGSQDDDDDDDDRDSRVESRRDSDRQGRRTREHEDWGARPHGSSCAVGTRKSRSRVMAGSRHARASRQSRCCSRECDRSSKVQCQVPACPQRLRPLHLLARPVHEFPICDRAFRRPRKGATYHGRAQERRMPRLGQHHYRADCQPRRACRSCPVGI
jgi:hypothetical protein